MRAIVIAVVATCSASVSRAQVTTVDVPCAADVAIYSESGTSANGAGQYLFLGANGQGNVRRSLLRFDVAAVIPAGSVVTSVGLYVYANQGNPGWEPATARRVLASWSEGPTDPAGAEGQGAPAAGSDVTWTLRNFASGTPWSTPGGDLAPEVSISDLVPELGIPFLDGTPAGVADVQAWLDHPALNHGWALLGNEGAASTSRRLESRTSTVTNGPPRLVVSFFAPGAQPVSFCPAFTNSTGLAAATSVAGSTSIAANDFRLVVTHAVPGSTGHFFFGPRPIEPVAFGGGLLCVAGPLRRLASSVLGPAGDATLRLDLATYPGTLVGPVTSAAFQFWYRDLPAGGAGFNLSHALLVPFFP